MLYYNSTLCYYLFSFFLFLSPCLFPVLFLFWLITCGAYNKSQRLDFEMEAFNKNRNELQMITFFFHIFFFCSQSRWVHLRIYSVNSLVRDKTFRNHTIYYYYYSIDYVSNDLDETVQTKSFAIKILLSFEYDECSLYREFETSKNSRNFIAFGMQWKAKIMLTNSIFRSVRIQMNRARHRINLHLLRQNNQPAFNSKI